MPIVHLIPVKRGMEPDEVIGRLQQGWQLMGRQMIKRGEAIATPSNPEGRFLENADVWMLDEPMIPQAMVAQMLLQAMAHEDPLEELAQELFGMDLMGLQAALEAALVAAEGGHSDAQRQHPGKD